MTVDVLNNSTGKVEQAPVTLEGKKPCKIRLRLAEGAEALQVVVRDGEKVAAAIEVPAKSGEDVTLELWRDSADVLQLVANRPYFVLPDENPTDPLLLAPPPGTELDLAVLVDGTCLHPGKVGLDYLLSPALSQEWKELAAQLGEFAASISAKYTSVWTTALAFGEQDLPDLSNPGLLPEYLLEPRDPEDRQLTPTSHEGISASLVSKLRALRYSPGGDFVDALADGLRACRDLWRDDSRKVLVVFGHSPGYSVLDPADEIANLAPRELSIEEEIEALHEKGVEVVTIFHHPASAEDRYSLGPAAEELFRHSRKQYKTIASLPAWSSDSDGPSVKGLASKWLNPPLVLARGAAPGFLVNS